jgi:hypothetical protein
MSETATVKSEAPAVIVEPNEVFDTILELNLDTCTVTVCLASVSKTETVPQFERLKMTEKLTGEFRKVIENLLKRYKTDWDEGDLLFPEYAAQIQPPEFEIEHIELLTFTILQEQISPLLSLADVEVFEEDKKFIDGLRFYVITVQPPNSDPIYFFRSYAPRKMLSRSIWFAAWLENGTYDRVTQPLLLFDEDIDCMSSSGLMFIFNKSNFQNIFRFFDEIRKVAKETLDTLKMSVPIQNFEEFARDCERHVVKLRKLRNIATRPYLGRITMDHVKKVIEKNNLPIQIAEVEGKEMLVYDQKVKWVLLKLLDDDYLWSMLTEQSYEVTGKRGIP